jgi:hypothetical protein
MPLDATTYLNTSPVAALARFREAPTLADLAILLRSQQLWPRSFHWDYGDCRFCAMGLAIKLTGAIVRVGVGDHIEWATKTLGLGWREFAPIFLDIKIPGDLITPEHVAVAIEKHLAAR